MVAACSLTFAAVIDSRHGGPSPPPFELIARDLGTTPDALRHVLHEVLPHGPAGPPTDAQKQQIAGALDVTVEQLDAAMDRYRPDRLRQR